MSADECLKMFYDFSKNAFQKRPGLDIPMIKYVLETQHRGRYKSEGINASLKEYLGEDVMFGNSVDNCDGQTTVKIGVTMTGMKGTAYLVTNYNRPSNISDEGDCYNFPQKLFELTLRKPVAVGTVSGERRTSQRKCNIGRRMALQPV
jgi:hypothetical protein